jgi:hypothetical protein
MRRSLLLSLVLALLAAQSCAPGFDPPSVVSTLRVLAVTADKPYALPGEEVTLRMTVHDGLGDADGHPRSLQILWVAGCFDPEGDQYYLCFAQLAETFAALEGGAPPTDLVSLQVASPEASGVPDAHSFAFTLPEDIVSRRPVPDEGPHYGIAYVFFAACAGTLAPAPLEQVGTTVPELPLRCLDAEGNPQGPDSFVPGYTQVYAFADGRTNANPATDGITLDGKAIPEQGDDPPVVARCPVTAAERRTGGCGTGSPTDDCTHYQIEAVVGDSAEVDPGAFDENGNPLREVVWVSYFADAGDVEPSIKLVSDARSGYLGEHEAEWIPPAEPGLVTLWAVTRDQRGGQSVVRRFVPVE